MEIAKEIKLKIFAQYLGQMVYRGGTPDEKLVGVTDDSLIYDDGDEFNIFNDHKLLLRPLTSITDDEAIEMAKLFGCDSLKNAKLLINRPEDKNNPDINFSVQVYTLSPEYMSYSTPKYWSNGYGTNEYQWLQTKGFDLPHYLLGGKTLKECDLCYYQND